jgi:hypothetical protein
MRPLRLLLTVATLVGLALVLRALLAERAAPPSFDHWPEVPRKPAGAGADGSA